MNFNTIKMFLIYLVFSNLVTAIYLQQFQTEKHITIYFIHNN